MDRNINKLYKSDNVAKDLMDSQLSLIGSRVIHDFDIDWDSCAEWRAQNDRALKLAKQIKEAKNFPWPGAANVKFPLITTAAIQFAARAYPEIVQGNDVVRCKIVGADPDGMKSLRADRVQQYMSYQMTEEMGDWEEDTDRLLHILPIIGCVFRKSFWCFTERRNDSTLLLPDEIAVNAKTKNMRTCRRFSHILKFYKNDIHERQASGTWLDVDLPIVDAEDEDPVVEFIEQHRFLDLDEDGYAEPYIVTVHKDSKKVVRIAPRFQMDNVTFDGIKVIRIKPDHYFTKYAFIPNPDGSFLDIGFGILLEPINESINTLINEILDAGAAHNNGGGFLGQGVNIKGGRLTFQLGEWKTVPTPGAVLKDNIVPLPTREPSQVLYLLLGTLIEAGRDISTVKNAMMGEKPGENVSAELFLSMVDQGLKVFTGIYKRIYRSLKQEFQIHYWLNGLYLDAQRYYNVLDDPRTLEVYRADFQYKDCDVYPMADPHLSLDIQRQARAQVLISGLTAGLPGLVPMGITKRWLEANKITNIEEIFDPQQQKPPDPKVEQIYLEMGLMRDKHNFEKQELFSKILLNLAKIKEIYSNAVFNIAKAESMEAGTQIEAYKAYVDQLGMQIKQQELALQQSMGTGEQTPNEGGGLAQPQEATGVQGISLPTPTGGGPMGTESA